jgi:hypothetical protein
MAVWYGFFGEQRKDGVLLGSPKPIRSDEWLVATPFVLSQESENFAVKNPNLGGNTDPLLLNVPVKHPTTLIRPQHWGFFLLDSDRAFSFYWDYRIAAIILSTFLVLMLITRNNLLVSVGGALWIFFSPFTQWWFSTNMSEIIAASSMIFIAFNYLIFAKNKKIIFAAATLFAVSAFNFITYFYPPFMFGLVYLYLAMFIGFLITNFKRKITLIRTNLKVRLIFLFYSLAFLASVTAQYLKEAWPTIKAILNADYPGKRISLGGENQIELFSGYFSSFYKQSAITQKLGNICEASNFLLFYPVVLVGSLGERIKCKKVSPIIISLLVFCLFFSAWVLLRFPQFFAQITFLSYIPPKRSFIALGLGSIFLTLVYLSEKSKQVTVRIACILAAIFLLAVAAYMIYFSKQTGYIFPSWLFFYVPLIVGGAAFSLLRKKAGLFFLFLTLLLFPNAKINPINYDNAPFKNTKVAEFVLNGNFNKNDRWIVYGSGPVANYLKGLGLNAINGVNYTPNMELINAIDKDGKFKKITNRYAHISFNEPDGQSEKIHLIQDDSYEVNVDPCDSDLKQLGLNYLVSSKSVDITKRTCLLPLNVEPIDNLYFYKYK